MILGFAFMVGYAANSGFTIAPARCCAASLSFGVRLARSKKNTVTAANASPASGRLIWLKGSVEIGFPGFGFLARVERNSTIAPCGKEPPVILLVLSGRCRSAALSLVAPPVIGMTGVFSGQTLDGD